MRRISLIILSVFTLLTFGQVVAFAQETATVSITEDFINQTYRVTTPPRTTVTNVSVDLQNGQVVIYATLTPRRTGIANATATTLYPTVANGAVTWTVASIMNNGVAASQDVVTLVNTAISASWRVYFRTQTQDNLQSVVISDSDITYTYTGNHPLNPSANLSTNGTTLTITEADINGAITVRKPASSASVDLQSGQVVINASFTARNGTTVNASATLTATVSNGKVAWTVASITFNGQMSASATTQAQNALSTAWNTYWLAHTSQWTVTAISITDTDIVVTGSKS